jgi:hypothetical protein
MKGSELDAGENGDVDMFAKWSSSPVLPRSSLAKTTKSGTTPVNLPPPSPLPKGFVPTREVMEEPRVTDPGVLDLSAGVALSLFPNLASQGTSSPGAAPRVLGARCVSTHSECRAKGSSMALSAPAPNSHQHGRAYPPFSCRQMARWHRWSASWFHLVGYGY